MSDFDSGDDLCDDVDTNQPLSIQPLPSATKRKRETEANNHSDQPKRQRNHGDDTLVLNNEGNIVTDVDAFPDDLSDELDLANLSAQMHLA